MHRVFRAWGWAGVLALVVSLTASVPASADSPSFSGRAAAIDGRVLGIPIVISDTGPLESTGGAREASLLAASVPGILSLEVLHATTVGADDRSGAHASVADLVLTAGGHRISASLLTASATASCGPGGASTSGSSEVADLAIDGQTYQVTTEPNQRITLLDGSYVVINEQESSGSGNTRAMTVNALHVVLSGVADVVISSAHADITCPSQPPVACRGNFVTGGGWIDGRDGRANFAVAGGAKNGGWWGHLQYDDHGGNGTTIKGTGVTLYSGDPTTTRRHIEGTAEMNGQTGYTYQVDVDDVAEPGKGMDTFAIKVYQGQPNGQQPSYETAEKLLRGGNIQLHCR